MKRTFTKYPATTITANDSVSGVVTGNVQISLYYNVASATTETVAESEGGV